MLRDRLSHLNLGQQCTLLCVGPMSRNCVDVLCGLSHKEDKPLVLIASRRQIDAGVLGGGYVNGWSTEEFQDYVRARARPGRLLLARDHGGPWQGAPERENGLSAEQAMEAARRSFRTDIESGFEMIHIDTSVDPKGPPAPDVALSRLFELYGYCCELALSQGRDIVFEVGTEEQSHDVSELEQTRWLLERLLEFCRANRFPPPSFVVAQTGAKVMELTNVGVMRSLSAVDRDYLRKLEVLVAMCNRQGVYLKGHNADYLSDEVLALHPRVGIHAINVAPEFGVAETRAFLRILRKGGLDGLADRFIQLSLSSLKWKKWMLPETTADDTTRATIAGHYVFSTPEFQALKATAAEALSRRGVNLDALLRQAIQTQVVRYMTHLNYGGVALAA